MRQRNAKCKGLTGHQSLKGKIRVPDLNDRLANLGSLVQFQLFLSCAIMRQPNLQQWNALFVASVYESGLD